MTRAQHLAAKMHLAIDALEKIALDFPTAGRGIERTSPFQSEPLERNVSLFQRSLTMANLLSMLGPIEGQLADAALAELAAHKADLLAAANAEGIKAIDAVSEIVLGALPTHGFAALVRPFLAKAITDAEPQIIALLGGEEEALFAAAQAALAAFAKAHGG